MTTKTIPLVAVALVVVATLVWWTAISSPPSHRISYSRFLDQVRQGEIAAVAITPGKGAATVQAWPRNGQAGSESVLPGDYREALALLTEHRVNIEIRAGSPAWTNAIPFLMLLSVWIGMVIAMRNRSAGLPPGSWFR